MCKFFRLIVIVWFISNTVSVAMATTDTDALQKLRDVCGTYFGATTPLSALSGITNAQVSAKLSATDINNITGLLASAATYFQGTAYQSEITSFSNQIQTLQTQASQVTADVTAIANLNVTDLTTKIGTLTATTDPSILTAVVTRLGKLFAERTSSANQTKDYYTNIIALCKAAQAKFTTDLSYSFKALTAAIEEVGFETDKITALKNIFSDALYLSYVKAVRGKSTTTPVASSTTASSGTATTAP